jgi:hypothetical protein
MLTSLIMFFFATVPPIVRHRRRDWIAQRIMGPVGDQNEWRSDQITSNDCALLSTKTHQIADI